MPKARKTYPRKPFHALSRKQKWLRTKKNCSGAKVSGRTEITAHSISSTNSKQNKLSPTGPIKEGPSFSKSDGISSLSSSTDESSLYSDEQSCDSSNDNSSLDEKEAAGEYELASNSAHSF